MSELDLTPEEALRCAKEGRLYQCVHNFLSTRGKNKEMAHGILRRKNEGTLFWVGPIQFSLKELTRCCGPEEEMEFVQTPESWEGRVGAMVEDLERGWQPPVLIANPRTWPTLSIRDGNHRYEAMQRAGMSEYWTLFWFDKENDLRQFAEKYSVPKEIIFVE